MSKFFNILFRPNRNLNKNEILLFVAISLLIMLIPVTDTYLYLEERCLAYFYSNSMMCGLLDAIKIFIFLFGYNIFDHTLISYVSYKNIKNSK